MKLRFAWKVFGSALFVWSLSLSVALGSSLRISMTDGTNVEVPYYWEEGGEVRFEIPGGVAGVPKGQVKSIQEIITSREFDPEVLVESPKGPAGPDQREILRDLVIPKSLEGTAAEKVETEEGLRAFDRREGTAAESKFAGERVFAPMSRLEGDFAELKRTDGRDVVLVMQNVLSSRTDLREKRFTLTLFDGEGNVIQQKPCELHELAVDNKTLRELNLRGRLYSVVASVKPDPKIKRYEISVSQR